MSRLDQFRSVPEEEAADASEELGKPSGRGRPKAKAKAKARGRPGRPKGKAKAKARGKATPKAKAKAKAKAHKEGGAGSQVKKTTRKRKAEEHQDQEEAAQQDAPVTPPKRSTRKDNAEHGSKTKRAKPAPKSAPRQRKRASRGEAISFARRNPPEGERGFAEWKAIREAYRVNLAHLKPQAKHEDATAQGFSSLRFFQQSCNFAYCNTSLHLECGVSGQVLEVLQGPKQRGYQGFHF